MSIFTLVIWLNINFTGIKSLLYPDSSIITFFHLDAKNFLLIGVRGRLRVRVLNSVRAHFEHFCSPNLELSFLLSSVPCWRLSGRRTVLFPIVAHLLSSLLCLKLAFNLDWSVVWLPLFGLPFAVAPDSLSCSLVALMSFFVPSLSVCKGRGSIPRRNWPAGAPRLRRTVVMWQISRYVLKPLHSQLGNCHWP